MTAVMLATYPELFAGGAIIAGLPFGAAANVRDALEAMRSAPLKTPAALGRCGARGIRLHRPLAEDLDLARRAGHHRERQQRPGQRGAMGRCAWLGADAAPSRKWWTAPSGSPGATARGLYHSRCWVMARPSIPGDVGKPAPFILDVGISSSRRIARFWGLAPLAAPKPVAGTRAGAHRDVARAALPEIEAVLVPQLSAHIRRKISSAARLRAVGLLKALEPAHQNQDQHDQKHQAQSAGRAIAPAGGIAPHRHRTQNRQVSEQSAE